MDSGCPQEGWGAGAWTVAVHRQRAWTAAVGEDAAWTVPVHGGQGVDGGCPQGRVGQGRGQGLFTWSVFEAWLSAKGSGRVFANQRIGLD